MKKSLIFLSVLSLGSCSHKVVRLPSSEGDKSFIDISTLSDNYKLNLELDQSLDRKALIERYTKSSVNRDGGEISANEKELEDLNQKIADLKTSLEEKNSEVIQRADDLGVNRPVSMQYDFENDYRIQNEKLIIQNPENYKMNGKEIIRSYSMDLNNTKSYQLGIVNLALNESVKKDNIIFDESAKDQRKYFEAKITCDADFKIKKAIFNKSVAKNKEFKFRIYEQSGDSAKIILSFNNTIDKCSLTFFNPEAPTKTYGVNLINSSHVRSKINSLRNLVDVCLMPDNKNLKGVEKFFLTTKYQSMTCSQNIPDIKTLEIPVEGIKAKAEALLGQALPAEIIDQKNPFLELDFSKAPKLNTIFVSYLVFRADFYGNLIARLVKWHADHGTDVRILVSDVITLKKDKKLLYGLVESSNNIKLQ